MDRPAELGLLDRVDRSQYQSDELRDPFEAPAMAAPDLVLVSLPLHVQLTHPDRGLPCAPEVRP